MSCLLTILLICGCSRRLPVIADPDVIVQLAEPVAATVWVPDPESGKLLKVEGVIPAGKLIVDRRKVKALGGGD